VLPKRYFIGGGPPNPGWWVAKNRAGVKRECPIMSTSFVHHVEVLKPIVVKLVPSFIWVLLILSEAHRLIEKKDTPFYFLMWLVHRFICIDSKIVSIYRR